MTRVYWTSRCLAATLGVFTMWTATGAAMEFYDTFDGATLEVIDGVEHITTDAGAVWANLTGPFPPYEIEALPGAVRIDSNGDWFIDLALQSVNGVEIESSRNWSIRSRMSMTLNNRPGGNIGVNLTSDESAMVARDGLYVGVNWAPPAS